MTTLNASFRTLMVTIFLLISSALGQANESTTELGTSKFSLGGGVGLTYVIPTAHIHFGFNIIEDTELRLGVEGTHIGWEESAYGLSGQVATDLIYHPNLIYFGGGLRLWYIDTVSLGLGAVGGLSIPIERGSFYLELEISYFTVEGFAGSSDSFTFPAPSLKTGLSYNL